MKTTLVPQTQVQQKLEHLNMMFMGYLNEIYGDVYHSPERAIYQFTQEFPREYVQQAYEELQWVLRQPLTEKGLEDILTNELDLRYWPPGDGKTYHQWLTEAGQQLANFLNPPSTPEDVKPANNPSPAKQQVIQPPKPAKTDPPKIRDYSRIGDIIRVVLMLLLVFGVIFVCLVSNNLSLTIIVIVVGFVFAFLLTGVHWNTDLVLRVIVLALLFAGIFAFFFLDGLLERIALVIILIIFARHLTTPARKPH